MLDTAAAVEVDPSGRLANDDGDPIVVLGEWSTPGQFEGWQVNNGANVTVANGWLTAQSPSGSANPLQIDLQNISSGPDLDFGYYDYLQTRLLLPSDYVGGVTFSFGTTTHGGFSTARTFEIPAEQIPPDGQWHKYRLDLGLETWWRDTLRDLRIEPLGDVGTGDYVSIGYVEVGDVPDDDLLINTNMNIKSGESLGDLSRMESKHFSFWWSPTSYTIGSGFDPNAHGRRALRMLEECYQVYFKLLGYDEPFENTNLAQRDGNRYKTNHTTWYDGYWMSNHGGFTYLNVGETGLRDEGWGNPVPHEYGHAVQGAQPGYLVGQHWESHANSTQTSQPNSG